MTRIIWAASVFMLAFVGLCYADSIEFNSVPAASEGTALSLNGSWKFRYVAGSDAGKDEAFVQPGFDLTGWGDIKVPGHWELQGFATPRYAAELAEGLGLYRRGFRVDAAKPGERRYLRFDGALFGYAVWLNGHKLGEWNSGFNPATFDVTELLVPGDNVLAVRISTRSRGWAFDTMDCWSISGIYRDVTLFTLPPVHLLDHAVRTSLTKDGGAEVTVSARANAPAELRARLRDPDGKEAGELLVRLDKEGRGESRLSVAKAQTWNAESPRLYSLELELRRGEEVFQKLTRKVGLREVTTADGVLRLNGRPIKLRGVDHHEIWPEEGRVATEERLRKDLMLMRQGNINFIRTSHYPPHPLLLDLADEMGIYVDCEVPFIHGREHLKDRSYQDDLYARARATVGRDKNHPCLIFWSVGNENPVNDLGLNAGKLVKELDPTRPITFPTMGSHFRANWEKFPAHVDLYAPHYPSGSTITEYAAKLPRPIVATEYAHMRGISRGGKGLQDAWDAMYASPRSAGGAIWQFQDQGILRQAPDVSSVQNADLLVWLDAHRYYDTYGYYGVDGIVYSDRTPQVDYWWVRKVYSPIQITSEALNASQASPGFPLVIENRHDFRSLDGWKLLWTLRRNMAVADTGALPLHAPSKEKEPVAIRTKPLGDIGDDVVTLELRCVDEHGVSVYERSLRIGTGSEDGGRSTALQKSLPTSVPRLETDDGQILVSHERWTLRVDRHTGATRLADHQGAELFGACGPHTGRKLLITELGKHREGEKTHWSGELLAAPRNLRTSAEKSKDGILIKVAGTYARPGFADQAVEGEYELSVRPTGAIKVAYRYAPVNAQDSMVETGFTFSTPAAQSEFRWIGQGPYASYPGKDRHAEFGVFHLSRDDLYFPGNRRESDLAMLTTPQGGGLLMAAEGKTISVENREGTNLLTHVAEVTKGGKPKKGDIKQAASDEGVDNKSDFKASSIKSISGRFVLIPLGDEWPAPLRRWFGEPGEKAAALRPFLRSYDQ